MSLEQTQTSSSDVKVSKEAHNGMNKDEQKVFNRLKTIFDEETLRVKQEQFNKSRYGITGIEYFSDYDVELLSKMGFEFTSVTKYERDHEMNVSVTDMLPKILEARRK